MLKFEDLAVYFSQEEWELLGPLQKVIYNGVMQENFETVFCVGKDFLSFV